MCSKQYTLTPKDIYRYAAGVLEPHLQWQDQGPKCTVTALLQVLFYAAGQLCSLYAACGRLRDAPSDQAVRDALAALCPEAETLESQLNASFAAQLPKAVKNRRWRLAIDLNLRPYYGHAHRRAKAQRLVYLHPHQCRAAKGHRRHRGALPPRARPPPDPGLCLLGVSTENHPVAL